MKKRFIFDFDGVLADSLSATMNNINFLSKNGFGKIPLVNNQHDMSSLFDVKLSDSLYKYGYDQKQIKKFFDLHTSLMCRDANKIHVFKEVFDYIQSSQCPASIVSSSYSTYMNIILRRDSKDNRVIFDDIFGREEHRAKSDKINTVLSNHGLEKQDIIYIGDTSSDILTCKEIGVEIIAVGYGFHPYEYLVNFEPDYCVNTQSELIQLLNLLR